jgi:hypothetical protein
MLFPYCQRCVAHLTAWEASGGSAIVVLFGGIIAAVIAGIVIHWIPAVVLAALALPAAWVVWNARRTGAKAACGESCAGPGRALAYLGWSGSESVFDLDSHTYAARFAEQNQAILANTSPQLAKLLEHNRVARLAVPTPAAAVPALPPPASVADWVARIEAGKGAVGRRNTLQRALDALHDKKDRQQVIDAAARFELAPVIEEVEGMAAHAARVRLQRAIDGFRADNIPEELQATVLRELDTRWRKLA